MKNWVFVAIFIVAVMGIIKINSAFGGPTLIPKFVEVL